jgi:hypothetical protein
VSRQRICFTESEAFQILWVLVESLEDALTTDTLSAAVLLEETRNLVRSRIDQQRGRD